MQHLDKFLSSDSNSSVGDLNPRIILSLAFISARFSSTFSPKLRPGLYLFWGKLPRKPVAVLVRPLLPCAVRAREYTRQPRRSSILGPVGEPLPLSLEMVLLISGGNAESVIAIVSSCRTSPPFVVPGLAFRERGEAGSRLAVLSDHRVQLPMAYLSAGIDVLGALPDRFPIFVPATGLLLLSASSFPPEYLQATWLAGAPAYESKNLPQAQPVVVVPAYTTPLL